MLACLSVGVLGCVGLYEFSHDKVSDIVTFAVGSCIAMSANMVAVSLVWALQTKITPPDQRILLLGINATIFMLGRGGGLKKNLKNISGT